jgi:hypothetical protein
MTRTKFAALAGLVGVCWLIGTIVSLTYVQYDFMRSLRWHPISAATIDWPSGLALGPYGRWMSAAFLICGGALGLFGWGLAQYKLGWGARLVSLSGLGMALLVLPTDPTYRTTPATWSGILHDASYIFLGLTLFTGMGLLARQFARHEQWRHLTGFTWGALGLAGVAFALKGIFVYVYLVVLALWFIVMAWRLWRTAG